MSRIAPDAQAPAATALLADHLADLIAGLEGRFVHVGETLANAIGTIDRMAAALDDIQRSLSPEVAGTAIARLRQAAERLAGLPAIQQRRSEEIATLNARTREMQTLLADVGEILHMLSIYGMSIKIASSGETAFFNFVTGMEGKLESGRRELRHFGQELDRFGKVIADVRQADRLLAAECRKIGPEAPAELTGSADALQAQLDAVVGMATDVGGVMRTVQAEVARMLSAIQIGDNARQRIEHCATILRAVDRGDPGPLSAAGVAHMARLVAAQMQATARDFAQENSALIAALDRLAPLATQLLIMIQGRGSSDEGDDVLARVESGIAGVSQLTGQLCEADRRLADLTRFVSTTLADLLGGLARIQRIAVDVQDISTNTRLLCRRHGTTGRAVAVIATEVAPCASRLDESSVGVARLIEALGGVDLARGAGSAADGSDLALEDALAIVRRACETSDRAMADGGGEARAIVASLESSASDLIGQRTFVEALEQGALDLLEEAAALPAGDAADDEALRAMLTWAASLYTMAREREVHGAFLLPGMAAPSAPPPPAIDDDDDGLF